MSTENWLILFIGITTLGLLLQGISLWVTSRAVRRLAERLEKQSADLDRGLNDVLGRFRQLAESLEPLGRMAEQLGTRVTAIADVAQHRTQELDSLLEEISRLGRDQAAKIDYVVSDTIHKIEQTTAVIQRELVRPVSEIAALVAGIRTGFEYLLGRRPAQPSQAVSDDELFV